MTTNININSYITDVINAVDHVISGFDETTYQNLVQHNATVITATFTLYVLIVGYRFLTRTLQADLMSITRHLVILLIVYGLLMSWNLYTLFFYNIFTNEPNYIISTLSGSNSSGHVDSITALNNIFSTGIETVKKLFVKASLSALQFLIYGSMALFAVLVCCLPALLLLIIAKVAMAILLGIAPLFIICLLFETTKNIFARWLQQLINFALVPIITTAVLSFMLSVINATLMPLQSAQSVDQMSIADIVAFLGLSLATAFLLKQVMPICAALSGGMNLNIKFSFDLPRRQTKQQNAGSGHRGGGGGNSRSTSGSHQLNIQEARVRREAMRNRPQGSS